MLILVERGQGGGMGDDMVDGEVVFLTRHKNTKESHHCEHVSSIRKVTDSHWK